VIEDAAQSFGAEYKGRKTCSLADVACTSFFPAKPLGCYGDGGMCFTDNEELAVKMRSIRVHGQGSNKYENIRIGINGRLDTLQAAILLAKFEIFPEEISLRQEVARRYSEGLSGHRRFHPPVVPRGYLSAWAQYSILAEDESHRETCLSLLKKAGIPSAIYYPKPLHLQGAFANLGYRKGDFPVSESCAQRIFSLPMYPYLVDSEQAQILNCIKD
jgi:dTDP-4-amino-4,6-dideoxygalactose transaminase